MVYVNRDIIMLKQNVTAPNFTSVDQDNKSISLEDFKNNKNVVLYFYPKDDTSGCTIEANQFTALKASFDELDTVILGVSKDDVQSHCNFISKFDLKVSLLADTDGKLCEDYGVWQEKEKNGVKKMGIVRSTFVIDKQGVARSCEYGVVADGHAEEVLNFIKTNL